MLHPNDLRSTTVIVSAALALCLLVQPVLAEQVASWMFDQTVQDRVAATDTVSALNAAVVGDASKAVVETQDEATCLRLNNQGQGDKDGVVLQVGDAASLTGHQQSGKGYGSLTIEAVVKLNSLTGQAQIVRKIDGDVGYELYILKDGRVGFRVKGTKGAGNSVSKNKIAADGQWHHIQGTYVSYRDPYNTQVVVDGLVSRHTRKIGTLQDTDSVMTIGGFIRNPGEYGQRFDGWIQSIHITTDRIDLLDKTGLPMDQVTPTGKHLTDQPGLIAYGFVDDPLPTPECHASTIAQMPDGRMLAAWFGGTCEGHPDVGVWQSEYINHAWTNTRQIVDLQNTDGAKGSIFNPVLYQYPEGPTLMFYLYGPLMEAKGAMIISEDGGQTWSEPRLLPDGVRGATKNKPVLLDDGVLVCPDNSNRLTFHRTNDYGKTWLETGAVPDPDKLGAIQPTILTHPDGRLQTLGRSSCGSIVTSWSTDGGQTWSPLERTNLPNNNSGVDAVTLKDGRHLLVYNPVGIPEGRWGGPRTPLSVAISDDGLNWKHAVTLEDEPGEYSYPSVIQADDGLVHVVYTWHRLRVKHAVIDPAAISQRAEAVDP